MHSHRRHDITDRLNPTFQDTGAVRAAQQNAIDFLLMQYFGL